MTKKPPGSRNSRSRRRAESGSFRCSSTSAATITSKRSDPSSASRSRLIEVADDYPLAESGGPDAISGSTSMPTTEHPAQRRTRDMCPSPVRAPARAVRCQPGAQPGHGCCRNRDRSHARTDRSRPWVAPALPLPACSRRPSRLLNPRGRQGAQPRRIEHGWRPADDGRPHSRLLECSVARRRRCGPPEFKRT